MRLRDSTLPDEDLTSEIIGAFYYVYNSLRFGFLETVYARALERVLERTGHRVVREVRVPVWFEREVIGYHRLDMLVDDKIVVEIKATERLHDFAERQLRSYLKATRRDTGLILHFGLKPRVHRSVRNRFANAWLIPAIPLVLETLGNEQSNATGVYGSTFFTST